MTSVKSILRMNPIIVKELRSRMRGGRAFITLTVSLIVIAGALYGMLQLMLAMAEYDTSMISPRIGQALFTGLAFIELALVCAITPAVTSGAISGEVEKQTYEMLQATPLNPTRILWGKLISALSYIFLLLFAGIPMASLVFIFGGVAALDMLKVLMVLVAIAVCYGVLGLFMSALFKRTGRATVASFIVVIVLTLVPIFVATGISVVRSGMPPRWILVPSPISLLSAVMSGGGVDTGMMNNILPILGGWWVQSAIVPVTTDSIPRPLYHYALPFYGGLTLILYLLSTRLLQPARRWRLKRKEIVIGAGSVLLFAGVMAGLFLYTAPRYEWVKGQPGSPTDVPGPVKVLPAGGGGVFMDGTPAPTPTAIDLGSASPESLDGMTGIYAAVVRQLFTKDHTFGDQPPKFNVIYILNATDDRAADPSAGDGHPMPMPDALRTGIAQQLSDLNVEIRWVDSPDAVAKDPKTGAPVDGGVIITLGNIYHLPDGTARVAGSIYIAGLAGGGNTYVLSEANGVWTVTGTTGAGWIS